MHLYLVRHGIAIDRDDPKCPPEPERYLTEEGIKKTRKAARGFCSLEVKPDLFLSSPYVRAVQTADIFMKEMGYSPDGLRRTRALLPGSDPDDLFRELASTDAQEMICFGHAPNVDELIRRGLGCPMHITEMKKAGVACLEFYQGKFEAAILLSLFTPKALTLMAR